MLLLSAGGSEDCIKDGFGFSLQTMLLIYLFIKAFNILVQTDRNKVSNEQLHFPVDGDVIRVRYYLILFVFILYIISFYICNS
ncbi:hypothetical protein LINPERHAP2_LOCUS8574 [Linum perenne]